MPLFTGRTFAKIGSISSLIPTSVKVLALTATAAKDTLDCVACSLSLENPALIGLPSNQRNIKYSVKHHTSIKEFTQRIVDDLTLKRVNLPVYFVGAYRTVLPFLEKSD